MNITISHGILVNVGLHILVSSTGAFNASVIDSGRSIAERAFCEGYNLVAREQRGKRAVSDEKRRSIYRAVAFHIGQLKHDFGSRALEEGLVLNMDKTHSVVNVDDGVMLDVQGSCIVKYHDVFFGRRRHDASRCFARWKRAGLATPMIIFENQNCSYHVRGVQDNAPDATHQTEPKG
ncbi:hypothetical protein PybrP1_005741 [[Pythium] brassicae (nom. inval.)]|nr:hypothetical protein PybrP1_005741 [[Pythium] brassicae (nom. inval.)]